MVTGDDDLIGKMGRTSVMVPRSLWCLRLEVSDGPLNTGRRPDGGAGDLSVQMVREDCILVFRKCEDQEEAVGKNRKG